MARYFSIAKPVLDNLTLPIRLIEGKPVMINIEKVRPYPYPASFLWSKNGFDLFNNSRVKYGYPSINFSMINRSDSGNYSLIVTNYYIDNPSRALGSSSGSFTLDVLCKL